MAPFSIGAVCIEEVFHPAVINRDGWPGGFVSVVENFLSVQTNFRNATIGFIEQFHINAYFLQEKVDRFTVDDNNNLTITLKEPVDGSRIVVYSIYNFQLFYDDFNDLVVKQYESGILSSYDYPDSPG